MNNVQRTRPVRTCTEVYSVYQSFRQPLKHDFNQRCGYCDDPDTHYGQEVDYHIDHFKPKSKFPNLETEYSNLIYSCPYCNRAKSNTWQDRNGFIDPCDNKYNDHLKRNNKGQIKPKTPRGEYIVKNLKLFIKRHELIWLINKFENQKTQLNKVIDSGDTSNAVSLLIQFHKIQCEIDKYCRNLTNG